MEKIYSQNSINTVGECKKDFDIVERIRDAIIHHGKEPVVLLNTENYLSFKIPMHVGNYSSNNLLPDILGIGDTAYPLLDYIRKVTVDLLLNMERIGNCIGNEYISKQPTQTLYLYGLIGICIKDFVNFLFPEGKLKFFMFLITHI